MLTNFRGEYGTDSFHDVTELGNGRTLHRFTNPAGEPYSAIYECDFERFSCERKNEKKMLKDLEITMTEGDMR